MWIRDRIESGSNDPMSYLLTMIGISLLGNADTGNIPLMIFMQLALGILVGVVVAPVSYTHLGVLRLLLTSMAAKHYT